MTAAVTFEEHAQLLHDTMAASLPWTFRHGSVQATVTAAAVTGNMVSVLEATATYEGVPVELDLPLHYVNAKATVASPLGLPEGVQNPQAALRSMIAATVRHHVKE